jgi:hypothetical protein
MAFHRRHHPPRRRLPVLPHRPPGRSCVRSCSGSAEGAGADRSLGKDSFDEVHFGKFASYYIRREFFFDVHPPLCVSFVLLPREQTLILSFRAKLLLAFAGWAIGYDGHFEFENIGESYVENKVPYIGLRVLPAILGSLVPPVVYAIMRESGYPRIVAILSASLVLIGELRFVDGQGQETDLTPSSQITDMSRKPA